MYNDVNLNLIQIVYEKQLHHQINLLVLFFYFNEYSMLLACGGGVRAGSFFVFLGFAAGEIVERVYYFDLLLHFFIQT